jgi:hypothetical protein
MKKTAAPPAPNPNPDDVLRRMLASPPSRHKPAVKKPAKKAPK